MKIKSILLAVILLAGLAVAEDKIVSIPESQLTEQQKQALKLSQADSTIEKAHGWVGIGKELGQAFDSAMGSLTARSNEFASTKVGKFTMFIVAWKVMGEQAAQVANALVHFFYAGVEMVVFLPLLIWSYRRNCITRSLLTASEGNFWNKKKTYQVYNPRDDSDSDEYAVKQWVHFFLLILFGMVFLITAFAY